ncbi:MAG: histidine triad nucleotide-binding protein [Geodermatophilaceae bacterium]|jgi:histidine triad (HIT) family protein|nr:histidine triad nucleotide-binding protein [Geodermatophilaceae bacterium]MDQ3474812.1 histidine triad nucleotide-binding protein [Actinomycetota bacterium]
MTEPDCLFCKIVAGDIPADVVHETAATLAFRDLQPQAPVHVLVIPKQHQPTAGALVQTDPTVLAEVIAAARDVAVSEGVSDSGYRLVINTGADAHQSVFHVHVHVLGGRAMGWPPG